MRVENMELVLPPKVGRCYQAANGERVEVISVCVERPFVVAETLAELTARKTFVVVRHAPDPRWHGSMGEFAITMADWHLHVFAPITRAEFRGESMVWSQTGAGWALIARALPLCDSRDIEIRRVIDAMIDLAGPNQGKLAHVSVSQGRHGVERVPLDGKVHTHREDAREAKRAWCAANKIRLAGPRDHFDYDDGGY